MIMIDLISSRFGMTDPHMQIVLRYRDGAGGCKVDSALTSGLAGAAIFREKSGGILRKYGIGRHLGGCGMPWGPAPKPPGYRKNQRNKGARSLTLAVQQGVDGRNSSFEGPDPCTPIVRTLVLL